MKNLKLIITMYVVGFTSVSAPDSKRPFNFKPPARTTEAQEVIQTGDVDEAQWDAALGKLILEELGKLGPLESPAQTSTNSTVPVIIESEADARFKKSIDEIFEGMSRDLRDSQSELPAEWLEKQKQLIEGHKTRLHEIFNGVLIVQVNRKV